MSSYERTFFSAAIIAALAAVSAGCTSTMRIPPHELPKLGTSQVPRQEWPVVWTFARGEQPVIGPVTSIGIEPVSGSGVARIFPPFSARIEGGLLVVQDVLGPKSFRLDDIGAVSVDYENRKLPRVIIGATLITIGAPFFGVGALMVGLGLNKDAYYSGALILAGLAGVGIGAGIGVPGIFLVTTDPVPPENEVARLRPTFRIGPGGASMSLDF